MMDEVWLLALGAGGIGVLYLANHLHDLRRQRRGPPQEHSPVRPKPDFDRQTQIQNGGLGNSGESGGG